MREEEELPETARSEQAEPARGYVVVTTTVADETEARELGAGLLADRLVACAQMIPIRSLYTWKGETADEAEVLVVLKTRAELYPVLERAIRRRHRYETPEIVMLPVAGGLDAYLDWIDEVTTPPGT